MVIVRIRVDHPLVIPLLVIVPYKASFRHEFAS